MGFYNIYVALKSRYGIHLSSLCCYFAFQTIDLRYLLGIGLKVSVEIHSLDMKSCAKMPCHELFLNNFFCSRIQEISFFVNSEPQKSHGIVMRPVKKDVRMWAE